MTYIRTWGGRFGERGVRFQVKHTHAHQTRRRGLGLPSRMPACASEAAGGSAGASLRRPKSGSLLEAAADGLVRQLARKSSDRVKRATFFRKAVDEAFLRLDVDGDGSLSLVEVYAGVLITFEAANRRVRAGVRAPSFAEVAELHRSADADGDGQLDRDEFEQVCFAVARDLLRAFALSFLRNVVALPLALYGFRWLLRRLRHRSSLLSALHGLLLRLPSAFHLPLARHVCSAVLAAAYIS